ncbi:permease [Paenibacillus piri]|uniref:Permease n=1 Tax=Paenibacillus piri TaxID=2547395 RepID=A0A4R5K6B9_9BACL|nr:permease [Paenibacillus piri]TDF88358.1 permease [Paenibacillus piri]
MQNAALQKKSTTKISNVLAGFSIILILILYFLSGQAPESIWHHPKLQLFKMMFISIIVEALPFILIGVVLSALVEVFVSEQTIKRMIPANPVLAILVVSLLGIIFPVCECGMVPAVRRFIQKGMKLHAAITFLVVGPILNPIVFWSTFIAFRNKPEMAYARMGLAITAAFVIGLLIYRLVKSDPLKISKPVQQTASSFNIVHHHGHGGSGWNKLVQVMSHSIEEFFDMGKFLMFGALLVGLLQAFVSKESLVALGHGQGSAAALMMGLGFILSLCSTSDAFVAQSFSATFSKGSLIAFMMIGPMLNLKGILMMAAVFKARFVLLYSLLVVGFVYASTLILEIALLN